MKDLGEKKIEPITLRAPENREEKILFGLIGDIIGFMKEHGMNQRTLALHLHADPARINHMVHYRLADTGKKSIYEWHEKLFPDVSKITLFKVG